MELKPFKDLSIVENIASGLKEEAKKDLTDQFYLIYEMAINDFSTSIEEEYSEESYYTLMQKIKKRYDKLNFSNEVLQYLASELLKKHSIAEINSMNKKSFDKEINKAYTKYCRSC